MRAVQQFPPEEQEAAAAAQEEANKAAESANKVTDDELADAVAREQAIAAANAETGNQ